MFRSMVLLAALSLATLGTSEAAGAQSYPTKPIRWIIPYPPGGGTDAFGRIVADRMSEVLKVPITVLNQAGGSGTIGSDMVRRADPDGYTLLFNASVFVLGKAVVKGTPYEPLEDFKAIGRIGDVPLVVIANPKVEGSTLAEIARTMRAKPDQFNIGLSSLGSAGHVATLEFVRQVGAQVELVTYRGAAPALTDLAAGSVQLMIDPLTVLLPQVQGGRAKALAITGRERSALAPTVPTAIEAGMPELVLSSWYGVFGPKSLPDEIVRKLSAALEEIARDPKFVSRVESVGIKPTFMGPAEASAFMRAEVEKSTALLRAANFVPE